MLASRANIIFGIITLFLLIPYLAGWALPSHFDSWILIISLALTGIPHGAIDHVIFLQNSNGNTQKKDLIKSFFIPYLLMIGVTFLLWFLFPGLMFWFFLGVSAYHFGQSQLFYIRFSPKSVLKTMLYMSWGIFILASLWLFHWEQQRTIIQSVFAWNLDRNDFLHKAITWATVLSGLLTLGFYLYIFKNGILSGKMLLQEIGVLILLSVLFYFTTSYLAFAVYFGLWHATRVIITEYHFLKMEGDSKLSIISFIKSFLPFSILSFAGLGILFWVSQLLQASISPFMLFLIFISALTMPHAFFMERMYRFLNTGFKTHKPATI